MVPTTRLIAQEDEATSSLALPEQAIEAVGDSATSTVTDDHSVLTSDRLGESKKDWKSPMSERRFSKSISTALEETPENLLKGPQMDTSKSLDVASDSDTEDGQSKASRSDRVKQQQAQHRAEHLEKKKMLRRRRLMRETDQTQDAEPQKVNPFNALPCFEYLELSADIEVDLPSGLVGFETMDLSEAEASPVWSIDKFNAENLADGVVVSDDMEVVDAAARMLDQINALPLGGLDLGATPPTPDFDAEGVSPEIRSELASDFSYVRVQSPVLPNAMRDNFLCHYATCPVREMHCEGPYYYKGRLGDQAHNYFKGSNPPPSVWEAYDKVVRGLSSVEEDEMVNGFWAWHVPPFCYIPEGPDDVFCSMPDEAGDAIGGDQDMRDT